MSVIRPRKVPQLASQNTPKCPKNLYNTEAYGIVWRIAAINVLHCITASSVYSAVYLLGALDFGYDAHGSRRHQAQADRQAARNP